MLSLLMITTLIELNHEICEICWRGCSACSFEKLRNDVQGLNQQSTYRLTRWKMCTTFSASNTKYKLHQTQTPPNQKMIGCQYVHPT